MPQNMDKGEIYEVTNNIELACQFASYDLLLNHFSPLDTSATMRLDLTRRTAAIVLCLLGCNIWRAATKTLQEDNGIKGNVSDILCSIILIYRVQLPRQFVFAMYCKGTSQEALILLLAEASPASHYSTKLANVSGI